LISHFSIEFKILFYWIVDISHRKTNASYINRFFEVTKKWLGNLSVSLFFFFQVRKQSRYPFDWERDWCKRLSLLRQCEWVSVSVYVCAIWDDRVEKSARQKKTKQRAENIA
jgi:hypothetical protein